jgi:hypothetical protein
LNETLRVEGEGEWANVRVCTCVMGW